MSAEGAAAPHLNLKWMVLSFSRRTSGLEHSKTQILKGKTKPLIWASTQVMVTPPKAAEMQHKGIRPIPLGLQVLHAFTALKMSSKVSVVVRNISESSIFLKKGTQISHIVSTAPIL